MPFSNLHQTVTKNLCLFPLKSFSPRSFKNDQFGHTRNDTEYYLRLLQELHSSVHQKRQKSILKNIFPRVMLFFREISLSRNPFRFTREREREREREPNLNVNFSLKSLSSFKKGNEKNENRFIFKLSFGFGFKSNFRIGFSFKSLYNLHLISGPSHVHSRTHKKVLPFSPTQFFIRKTKVC